MVSGDCSLAEIAVSGSINDCAFPRAPTHDNQLRANLRAITVSARPVNGMHEVAGSIPAWSTKPSFPPSTGHK